MMMKSRYTFKNIRATIKAYIFIEIYCTKLKQFMKQ